MREKNWQFIQPHRGLGLIVIAFLALGITYSIITPIFEAGDELWHYPFVQSLATGHGLPIQDPNVKTLWEQEGGQPPLYYAMSALATFWIDTTDLPERLWRNPEAKIGIPLAFGNKNMVVHTSAESFPWHNTTLAVHLIRFLSLILSAFTIGFTYFFALEIKDDKRLAVLAASFVAFNPMFIFISASVNNDNLATMLATLALVRMTQLITRGATLRHFVILGIVLGLGALAKISNLGLLVIAAVVFVYLFRQKWDAHKPGQTRITKFNLRSSAFVRVLWGSCVCAGFVIVIAFWWYARNWVLYGDPSAFNVWVQIAGGRPTPATLTTLFDEFQGFRISFWGNLGGVNLIAPSWVYTFLDVFTVLTLIGLALGFARRGLPRLLTLPAVWLLVISLSLVRWTLLTLASQGRLIFPAISAVAILLAFGLAQFQISGTKSLALRFTSRVLPFTFAIYLFTFSLLAPFTIIAPAYVYPARVADESSIPNLVHLTFDQQAELVGYALPQKTISPGDDLPLILYWRTRERIGEDFSVSIVAFDASDKIVARWNAFPGGGMFPTRLWQPSEIVADAYRIPVALDARAGVGRIEVSLFRRMPLANLTARDPHGNIVTPSIARFKIAGAVNPQIENPRAPINFGDQMTLVGSLVPNQVARGETLRVKLEWRAFALMHEDYTVFVHLVDANGKMLAQQDNQPQHGAYPTSFWDVGEIVADEYALVIPRDAAPGEYRIESGIYRASDNVRLQVQGGDSLNLGIVRVLP